MTDQGQRVRSQELNTYVVIDPVYGTAVTLIPFPHLHNRDNVFLPQGPITVKEVFGHSDHDGHIVI